MGMSKPYQIKRYVNNPSDGLRKKYNIRLTQDAPHTVILFLVCPCSLFCSWTVLRRRFTTWMLWYLSLNAVMLWRRAPKRPSLPSPCMLKRWNLSSKDKHTILHIKVCFCQCVSPLLIPALAWQTEATLLA